MAVLLRLLTFDTVFIKKNVLAVYKCVFNYSLFGICSFVYVSILTSGYFSMLNATVTVRLDDTWVSM